MADVEQTDVGDLFKRSVFEIPKYQRGYSWEEQQVHDLLEDIQYTYQERNNRNSDFTHYLGTFVLHDTGIERGGANDFDSYDIIDGQQRLTTIGIIIRCLNNEIKNILDFDWEDIDGPEPEDLIEDNRTDFIITYDTIRIKLDNINNRTYEKLVVDNEGTEKAPDQNLAQRRIIKSKLTVQRWFSSKREEFVDETIDYVAYYEYLREFARMVRSALEVTTYIIEDETEAGRLFEVVNDRGKDLTTLDRIKSYLVYCTSRNDENRLASSVYRRIGEVIKNITENGGGDDDLETFVNHHWVLFSGEINRFRGNPEYTEIHRRIKHLEKHAERNRDEDELQEWIKSYLDSLTACSEAYAKIENPELIVDNKKHSLEIKGRLDAINQLPVSGNFYPLLMTGLKKYGIGPEFRDIATLCEIFSYRVYNVASRRTDAAGNPLRRHAYWLEWAGKKDKARLVFGGEETPIHHSTPEEALSATCKMLESQIGKHCPDTYFIRCLMRDDMYNGSDENDGWTGVRTSEVLTYLLYKYEKSLRKQEDQSSVSQIPSFSQWKKEGITIEHIYPQNPDESVRDASLEEVVNSLGNLVLLSPEDNSGASNDNYLEKYEQVYSNSSMKMVEELPEPTKGWSKDDIRERATRITRFALQEWGNLSKAYVHIKDTPVDFQVTELTSIAHDVRGDYSSQSGFRIPSVHFRNNSTESNGEWETVNSCTNCDSTLVDLNSTEGWDATCRECGMDLDDPVYKTKLSDHVSRQ